MSNPFPCFLLECWKRAEPWSLGTNESCTRIMVQICSKFKVWLNIILLCYKYSHLSSTSWQPRYYSKLCKNKINSCGGVVIGGWPEYSLITRWTSGPLVLGRNIMGCVFKLQMLVFLTLQQFHTLLWWSKRGWFFWCNKSFWKFYSRSQSQCRQLS